MELSLVDATEETVYLAKLDYLAKSDGHVSGYASLGVRGGDGKLMLGSDSDLVSFGSSLDDNFNTHGYLLFEDSPATDAQYTPNAEYPDWNYWVEVRLSRSRRRNLQLQLGLRPLELLLGSGCLHRVVINCCGGLRGGQAIRSRLRGPSSRAGY